MSPLDEIKDQEAVEVQPPVMPKPYTGEMIAFLLINAMRNLKKEQLHNLAISLAVRDELFSIEEYERQTQG